MSVRGALLAGGERADAGAERRGRARAADLPRIDRPRAAGRPRRVGRRRRAGGRRRPGRAGRPLPGARGRRVLRAGRDPRRARVAAAARRSARRRRGRAGAGPAAGRAELGRHRPVGADRPAAQARHGLGAGRRDRVAPAPAGGARADRRLPAAVPVGRRRAGQHAAGPLRPPPDRSARTAPPAALHGAGGRRRAARQPRQARRAGGRPRASVAVVDATGVRPLHRRRRGRRPRRGGGDRRGGSGHRRRDLDGRGGRPRVRSRVRARTRRRTSSRESWAAGRRSLQERITTGRRAADSGDARMRRVLGVAITRARVGVVLSYAASSRRLARQAPSPLVEDARAAVGGVWEDREEELFGPAEALHSTFRELRDELLDSVLRIGGRLGELRLDTDLDISHGAVRFLELVKFGGAAPAGRTARRSTRPRLPTSTPGWSRRRRRSSGRSSSRRRSTTICSPASTTTGRGRLPAPRARSRRSSRSFHAGAPGSSCRRRTSTPTGRVR